MSKGQYKTMAPGYHNILTFRYVYKRSLQHLQANHVLYFQQYNIIFMLNWANSWVYAPQYCYRVP